MTFNTKINELQNRFLYTLLESANEIAQAEIEKRIISLGLNMFSGPYVVAIIRVKYDCDNAVKDNMIDEIGRFINESLINLDNAFVLYNSNEEYLILTKHSDNNDDLFANVKQKIKQKYCFESYIGVGRNVSSLQKIHISANEAQEALKYRSYYNNNGIIKIDDVVHLINRSRVGSNNAFQNVINCFISNDIPQMKLQLNNQIEAIRFTPQVSKSSIKRAMIELTVSILNIASNMGVDVDKTLNGVDPYTWIISQSHTEVITAWFIDLCIQLIKDIEEKQESNYNSVVDQVCVYIESNISDCSLGLVSISDYVNLTPQYLSMLFKKEKNIGINSYITKIRINKATELIKNTQIKMEEVASMVGYSSASYFNQSFKNATGISPNQFRKNLKKSK